jgi:hypothetical protein
VIIVDANVLLYAVNETQAQHARARQWIEQALNGNEAIGFAWIVLLAFVRVATRRPLFPSALDVDTALDQVNRWLGAPPAVIVQPTTQHASVLHGLLSSVGTAGNLVNDAHLAALCIEHHARVCSFDRDFARFPGVNVIVPGDQAPAKNGR